MDPRDKPEGDNVEMTHRGNFMVILAPGIAYRSARLKLTRSSLLSTRSRHAT